MVVLPTPPFWLAIAMTRFMTGSLMHSPGRRPAGETERIIARSGAKAPLAAGVAVRTLTTGLETWQRVMVRILYTHNICAYRMRMKDLFARDAPKRPVNVSVNSDLLDQARKLGINLSATLEAALADAVRRGRRERWLAENRGAIDAYNQYVDAHGVFSDGKRTF